MIWDIDLIVGMRVYNHKLQINFEIHSGWMIIGQLTAVWALKFGQIFSCHHFIWNICESPLLKYSRRGHSCRSDTSSFIWIYRKSCYASRLKELWQFFVIDGISKIWWIGCVFLQWNHIWCVMMFSTISWHNFSPILKDSGY
jgi:hypothetical protein